MSELEVRIPDLGDFDSVDVIEVGVTPGDVVEAEQGLITIESDKASMEVPTPEAGRVRSVHVDVGDRVSTNDLVVTLETRARGDASEHRDSAASRGAHGDEGERSGPATPGPAATGARDGPAFGPRLLVLGAGPGGYTAAFRAADLGLDVTLVERSPVLGGVCLNVGCIPSKALLHAARVIEEAREMGECGVSFGAPSIDAAKLVAWKNSVVGQLTRGLSGLARQRNVEVLQGYGRFVSANSLAIETEDGATTLEFDQCIIAAGSEPAQLPGWPEDSRVIDSTGALELDPLPRNLLVVGGGIIGLEMATVYEALGVQVSVVELTDTLIPGCDRDLVRPLHKRLAARYEAIMLGTRVAGVSAGEQGLTVTFEGKEAPQGPQTYERALVAVGRRPNGALLDAERAGVAVDERGFIGVDKQMRTNVPHIFAIGDVVGHPMLAHKASHEGRVAAEAAAGRKAYFDARAIPSVAYTDPEVAWVGLSEEEAKAQAIDYEKGSFPWAASGRSLSLGRSDGLTKLIVDRQSRRVLGAGIVGTNAGELIAEVALAIEMGADAEDVGLTIHPHPTLSETLAFAAEAVEGTITDLYVPKR
jgi:dihydrolipoamide dehydrogenase